MRQYMADRRARRRRVLVVLLGGKCARCSSEADELDFDHVEPGSQLFRISGRGLDKPWLILLAEVAKCQLLCPPCHRIKSRECGETGGGHNKITEHGTEAYCIREKCRCELCVTARRDARIRRGETKGIRSRPGTVDHGGGLKGKYNCKCGLCKAKRAEYARNRRSRIVKQGITDDR
jgi:hypothetical protein